MRKQLQKFFAKKKNNKGFTLIELIIVIAILAILVGIVGMASIRYVEKSRISADEQTLDSVSTAVQAVIIEPENNITVASGSTVKVEKNGKITITPKEGIKSTNSDFNFEKLVKDSLAKEPELKSQKYKDGATLTINKTGDTDIKVSTWGAVKVGG